MTQSKLEEKTNIIGRGILLAIIAVAMIHIMPMIASAYEFQAPGRVYDLNVSKSNVTVDMGTYKSGANYYGVDVTSTKLEENNKNHPLWVGAYLSDKKNAKPHMEDVHNFSRVNLSMTYDSPGIFNTYRTFYVKMSTNSQKTRSSEARTLMVHATFWTIQY